MNKEEEFIYNNTQHYGRAQFVREIAKLQEENKQLKERIEYLERSNNRREDEILYLREELSDREEEKINKAIEYIELYTNRLLNDDVYITPIEMRYLLKLLKGEENE